jgi:hypothetical protein
LGIGAIWDVFTTFLGIAQFFDLPIDAKLSPAQFTFTLVVTLVVFGFVIASHLIWSLKSDDIVALILKAAWGVCVVIDFITSWWGTKRFVFPDSQNDFGQAGGLLVITFLVVSASILLSRLLLAKDIRGKPFLF